jgi:2-C-methyl-D-erythritol 4-phosphate cytidylyltransferase/2-C-methyl-D-erythritol 2,4-cyclodiphosphate synthase
MTKIAAIILAAGEGRRFGGFLPKPYLPLYGVTILEHAVSSMALSVPHADMFVVFRPEHRPYVEGIRRLYPEIAFVTGGQERMESCLNAYRAVLEAAQGYEGALVHDSARPFVPKPVLERLIKAREGADAVVPVLAIPDTVKRFGPLGVETLDRNALKRAQTPQYVVRAFMRRALEAGVTDIAAYTDDSALAAALGGRIVAVEGSDAAHKLTEMRDLSALSDIYIHINKITPAPTLVGHGYDVHRLIDAGEGKGLVLGGVTVPFDKKLQGHSDADVLLHAATDAILGAINARDIGYHFPDGAPELKGRGSDMFVRYAQELAQAMRYGIAHLDVTVVCQRPKLSSYIPLIQRNVAHMLDIERRRVSVKATTEEGLGFSGRGEGIACHADVVMERK